MPNQTPMQCHGWLPTPRNALPRMAGFKIFFSSSKQILQVSGLCLFGWLLVVWLPGFQRVLAVLERNKKCSQLLFGQWDHSITPGWLLMVVSFNGTSTTSGLASGCATLLLLLGLPLASSSWPSWSWSDMVPSFNHASFLLVMKSWKPG